MSSQYLDEVDDRMREFTESLIRLRSITNQPGAEREAQDWFEEQLAELGFETYTWLPDGDELAAHPSFPEDVNRFIVEDRPSVGGVLEFGTPDSGPTLLLNGHMDVVSVDDGVWETDPFEPHWDNNSLTARGAADMKSGLTACVFAALWLSRSNEDLNGRIVVESLAGEEDGGLGSAAASINNPYPFERDAAIVAEPTELNLVTAMEGTLFLELEITGLSAHAGSRWEGESVLPHFENIRNRFMQLEKERAERVSNPLYSAYPIPWPVNFGVVEAGSWPSSVPANLTAKIRIGVAPGEHLPEVEEEFRTALQKEIDASEWLTHHPPSLTKFAPSLPSGETAPDQPIMEAISRAMGAHDLDPSPVGVTYGTDATRYISMAGIPSVLFGPGSIEQAHHPNETIDWGEVRTATSVIKQTAENFLG